MKTLKRSKKVSDGMFVSKHGQYLIPARKDKMILGQYTSGGPRVLSKKMMKMDGKQHEIKIGYIEPEGVFYHGAITIKVH